MSATTNDHEGSSAASVDVFMKQRSQSAEELLQEQKDYCSQQYHHRSIIPQVIPNQRLQPDQHSSTFPVPQQHHYHLLQPPALTIHHDLPPAPSYHHDTERISSQGDQAKVTAAAALITMSMNNPELEYSCGSLTYGSSSSDEKVGVPPPHDDHEENMMHFVDPPPESVVAVYNNNNNSVAVASIMSAMEFSSNSLDFSISNFHEPSSMNQHTFNADDHHILGDSTFSGIETNHSLYTMSTSMNHLSLDLASFLGDDDNMSTSKTDINDREMEGSNQ